ncbi:alpha/beta fold hydrolase [Gordonia phosphorivorans]|uniref:Alpha/beta fold hydrolase n=1 Tax=Gordonia phosphorivorans TaxID=1056982 RepID=A0ABV6HDE9_9ACTN
MSRTDRSRWLRGLAWAGGTAAALLAADLALVVGGIAKAAWEFPDPIDDGPDPRLTNPHGVTRSSAVPTSDGTLLHVETSLDLEDHPSDEVVVLVHGWTCSTRFWNAQVNHLAGDRPIIAYDHRGHGLSELGTTPPSIELLGQDLQTVLEATLPEGKRAVLVGHSMGGMTIVSWAKQFSSGMGDRVAAVVLASTTPRHVVQEQRLTADSLPWFAEMVKPLVARAFVSSPMPLPNNALTSKLAHYISLGPKARQAHVDFSDDLIARGSPVARAAWGSAMYHLDIIGGLEAISVPTIVVVGTEDRLTPPLHAEFMAQVLEDNGVLLEYVTYDGAGHMVPIERADEFNRLLDDLLLSL